VAAWASRAEPPDAQPGAGAGTDSGASGAEPPDAQPGAEVEVGAEIGVGVEVGAGAGTGHAEPPAGAAVGVR
jgi:hypothetical protein